MNLISGILLAGILTLSGCSSIKQLDIFSLDFERAPLATSMVDDFTTGNMRFKARERYSFGFSDPRCVFGSPGA